MYERVVIHFPWIRQKKCIKEIRIIVKIVFEVDNLALKTTIFEREIWLSLQ